MEATIENIQAAYVVVLPKDGSDKYKIGLAHRGIKGYSPNYGEFDYGTTYDEACKFVDELNKDHYGHTKREATKIVMSTMF